MLKGNMGNTIGALQSVVGRRRLRNGPARCATDKVRNDQHKHYPQRQPSPITDALVDHGVTSRGDMRAAGRGGSPAPPPTIQLARN